MGRTRPAPGEPIIVKKYANRRLYDTGRSAYVTLDDLNEMVRDNIDFVVHDAKSGEDLTRSVLTQIVAEQETKGEKNGESLLPTDFLRKLIGMYGENMHKVVPGYLEQTMQYIIDNQNQMLDRVDEQIHAQQERMQKMGEMFPATSSFEEISRRNMELFQSAMKNFTQMGDDSKK